jgi:tetratricopeptide (TPR) repeat protein
VAVVLFDRVFLSGSFQELVRRRWGLYLGLAGTWSVLWTGGVAQGVLSSSRKVATVGFSFKDVTPLQYAATQFGVLVKYLQLSFWPHPLCLDYAWPTVETVKAAILPAIVVAVLLAAVVWGLMKRQWWGFAGAWFFVILTPTSSIIPIKDPLFEHRMYLPLASVIVIVVLAGHRVCHALRERVRATDGAQRAVAAVLVAAISICLGVGTARRNLDYRDALTMWQDVVTKRPLNMRAHYNLGKGLLDARELDAAIAAFRQALRLAPLSEEAHYNLGKALCRKGDRLAQRGYGVEAVQEYIDQGRVHYLEALRINPKLARAHSDLGNLAARSGRPQAAIARYREAVRVEPDYVQAYYNLGSVLLSMGETGEAVDVLRRAVRLSPQTARIRFALGNAYRQKGMLEDAADEYKETLRIDPEHEGARLALDRLLTRPDVVDEP